MEQMQMNMPDIYDAALYLRLSKDDMEEGGAKSESNSIANQRELLRSFVKSQPDIQIFDIYVDDGCDLDMAANIVYNAKTSRPSVCNAAESLLVHENVAEVFLPYVKMRLDEKNVEIRGCEITRSIIDCVPATEEDYYREYLDYIISVKVVRDVNEAIAHINEHSTGHSECIVTNDLARAELFTRSIDSAAVYVNASTRFTDGFEFGLGAEIGISTQKMHARGPMGLKELTTFKYIVVGNGQIR